MSKTIGGLLLLTLVGIEVAFVSGASIDLDGPVTGRALLWAMGVVLFIVGLDDLAHTGRDGP